MPNETLIALADASRGISLALAFTMFVQVIYLLRLYRWIDQPAIPRWAVYVLGITMVGFGILEVWPHVVYFGQEPVLPNWVASPPLFLAANAALAALNSRVLPDLQRRVSLE